MMQYIFLKNGKKFCLVFKKNEFKYISWMNNYFFLFINIVRKRAIKFYNIFKLSKKLIIFFFFKFFF